MIFKENFKALGGSVRKHILADSYGDFIQYLTENKSRAKAIGTRYDRKFTGTDNLDEALDLAKFGWEEGLKKCEHILASIEPRLFSCLKKREVEYHYAGGVPDVGVFLANDPECFLGNTFVEDKGKGKMTRIVCNVFASAFYSKEQLITRGVCVLAVVDALEKQGRSCEIVVMETVQSHGGIWEIEVPIKKAGQVAEMERIAFALAHPSFLRRLCFAAQDLAGMNDRPAYGMPCETRLDKGDLYFPEMSSAQCPHTTEGMVQWVLGMLQDQGIELEDA
jgi:hypothetical protein